MFRTMKHMLKYLYAAALLLIAFSAFSQNRIDRVCAGTERYYRVTGEPGSTYSWTLKDPAGSGTLQASDQDTVGILWNVSPGIYQLTVIQHAANGCDAPIELGSIEVLGQPQASAGPTLAVCAWSPVLLTGSSASNYDALVWSTSGDGTFSDSTVLHPVYTPGAADRANGFVTLTLKASGPLAAGGCLPAVSQVKININSITATALITPASCVLAADGSVQLTASGGVAPYEYLLNGVINTTGTFTNLPGGSYAYQVTDAIGCSATGNVVVDTLDALTALFASTNNDCFGGSKGTITLSGMSGGSGTYEYSIDGTTWQNSPAFTGLTAGTYTVYIRDANAQVCFVMLGTTVITQPVQLYADAAHTNVSAPGMNDGSITVFDQVGGSGTYEYSLDMISWQSSPVFTGLAPGLYTVYMRDAAVTDCIYIIGDQLIMDGMKLTVQVKPASCFGFSDGMAWVSVSGGTHPYQFHWNDAAAQTNDTAFNLSAGTYVVTVTDALGFTATASALITEPAQVTVAFDSIGPYCMGSTALALPSVSVNGISGTWTPDVVNTTALGTFIYTFIPDSGQCGDTTLVSILITDQIQPLFAPVGPFCLNSPPLTLPGVSINGITGTWNPPAINTYVSGPQSSVFTPDAGQCAAEFTLNTGVGSPSIDSIHIQTAVNGQSNGMAIVFASGDITPFSYSLNGTLWQSSNLFSGLAAGPHVMWVKDASGCVVSKPFLIPNTVTGIVTVEADDADKCISLPIEIPVSAFDFDNIASFTIQLTYDSTMLSYTGLSMINQILNDGTLNAQVIAPGVLQITFVATDSITMYNDGLLFNLNFLGLAEGKSELKWDWLKCVIYSAGGYELPAIYTMGSVEIHPAPKIFATGGGRYCEGTELTLVSGSLNMGSLLYGWTGPSGQTHPGTDWDLGALTLADSGTYHITATDSLSCSATDKVLVDVRPNPIVNLADKDTLCSEQAIVLTAGPGYASYVWQNGSTDSTLIADSEGIYWVAVTDFEDCKGADTVVLRPCQILIWMPTAFTPNADNLNDIFGPRYNLDLDFEFEMYIFNKWGEQLFYTHDLHKGWDGTYKGKPCPPDMYTWTIKFRPPDSYNFLQKSPQSGYVMLLK
jgi:gliding motility-associated-like protein